MGPGAIFVIVTASEAVAPTSTLPKFSVVVDAVIGSVPVPVSPAVSVFEVD